MWSISIIVQVTLWACIFVLSQSNHRLSYPCKDVEPDQDGGLSPQPFRGEVELLCESKCLLSVTCCFWAKCLFCCMWSVISLYNKAPHFSSIWCNWHVPLYRLTRHHDATIILGSSIVLNICRLVSSPEFRQDGEIQPLWKRAAVAACNHCGMWDGIHIVRYGL